MSDPKFSISLEKFEQLLRKNNSELASLLHEVEIGFEIDGTKAFTTCHLINLTANGEVRINDLAEFLANKVMDFAIPRSEIIEAEKYLQENNSSVKLAKLLRKAQSLFTTLEKSGEGGEVLLYLLIEHILKVPQILCKMNLKTSSAMHVHGCDGIHAKFDDGSGLLSLFWGESKLYQSLGDGFKECLDSLKSFLIRNVDSTSQDRDIQLVRNYIDLNDERLETALVSYLDKDHENYNKVIYKGACLVGFNYTQYPTVPNSGATIESIKSIVEKEIGKWKETIKKKISEIDNLETFELHIFLLPFPSVQSFRDSFLNYLGIKRDDENSGKNI